MDWAICLLLCFGYTHGQGSNLSHVSSTSHCSYNIGSLTHCATRELLSASLNELFSVHLSSNLSISTKFYFFKFFYTDFYFSIIASLQCSVSFLLHSKVTQSNIRIDILFSQIMLRYN